MMIMTMVPAMAFAEADASTGIAINKENFPDDEFRKYISENLDVGYGSESGAAGQGANDGYLNEDELNVKYIEISDSYITDLTGIEHFTSLRTLRITNSFLSDVNVNKLPAELRWLDLSDNKLTGILDISNLDYLERVELKGNLLTGLQVSSKAKYYHVTLGKNCLSSKSAVTGREYIDWESVFYFGTQKTYCEVNGHDLSEEIIKAIVDQTFAHDGREGSIYMQCSRCQYNNLWTDEEQVIPAVASIELSKDSYTYNGKAQKPDVTVYDVNGNKIDSSNYTVSYSSGCKNVGKYKATVNFKGRYYSGSCYGTFKINPKGTSISKLSKGKKSFNVKWKKQTGKMAKSRITGYQYRYSTSSKITKAKTVTVKGYSKTSAKKTKLSAKKKYYVQVRTYMTVKGVKYYSDWSKTKSVTTK